MRNDARFLSLKSHEIGIEDGVNLSLIRVRSVSPVSRPVSQSDSASLISAEASNFM